MNFTHELGEARSIAHGLRTTAASCSRDQLALRTRLVLAAESLESLAQLAARAVGRIETLEGALRECLVEMQAWDRMEDRTTNTRVAITRAQQALKLAHDGGAS